MPQSPTAGAEFATRKDAEVAMPNQREHETPAGHAVSPWSKNDEKGPLGPYSSHEVFRKVAQRTAHGVGHPWAFAVAVAVVVVWAITGPLFHFSDTWQLVINTGTTIVTFLMVFLIQNTQNRDSHAIHLKLDELIRANTKARNILLAAEELDDRELNELQHEFERLAREKISQRDLRDGDDDDDDDADDNDESEPQSASSRRTRVRSSRTRPSSN